MNKLLPLGTVIEKKNENHKLMIYGYFPINTQTNESKDYLCCLYPEGTDMTNCWNINNEEIARICFVGYQTPYYTRVRKTIKEINETDEKDLTDEKLKEIINKAIGGEKNAF